MMRKALLTAFPDDVAAGSIKQPHKKRRLFLRDMHPDFTEFKGVTAWMNFK